MIEDTYVLCTNDHFTIMTIGGDLCVGIGGDYVFGIRIPYADGDTEPLSEETISDMTYQVYDSGGSFPDEQFDAAIEQSLSALWSPGKDYTKEVIEFLRKHFELELASADLEARKYVRELEIQSLPDLRDEYEEPLYRETGERIDWTRNDVLKDFAELASSMRCHILTYDDILKEVRNA